VCDNGKRIHTISDLSSVSSNTIRKPLWPTILHKECMDSTNGVRRIDEGLPSARVVAAFVQQGYSSEETLNMVSRIAAHRYSVLAAMEKATDQRLRILWCRQLGVPISEFSEKPDFHGIPKQAKCHCCHIIQSRVYDIREFETKQIHRIWTLWFVCYREVDMATHRCNTKGNVIGTRESRCEEASVRSLEYHNNNEKLDSRMRLLAFTKGLQSGIRICYSTLVSVIEKFDALHFRALQLDLKQWEEVDTKQNHTLAS
jgi:hypothetical protein